MTFDLGPCRLVARNQISVLFLQKRIQKHLKFTRNRPKSDYIRQTCYLSFLKHIIPPETGHAIFMPVFDLVEKALFVILSAASLAKYGLVRATRTNRTRARFAHMDSSNGGCMNVHYFKIAIYQHILSYVCIMQSRFVEEGKMTENLLHLHREVIGKIVQSL